MARITHPVLMAGTVKSHFGVIFTDGVADVELTPFMRRWYENRGYGVDESQPAPSKTNLQAQATELGIDWKAAWTKADLAEAIADAAAESDPATGGPAVEVTEG